MRKTVHAPEFLTVVHTLKPLLRQYQPLSVLHTETLADWLAWYWNRGTMTWQVSDLGEPQGVCLIRLFRYLEQFLDPNAHEPCNEFCFIEFSIASDPIIMGMMFQTLSQRWGPQNTMMWDRGARTENGAPRMYTWKQFRKLARRLSYGIC